MTEQERCLLEEILYKYRTPDVKENLLEQAFYTDKLRLLYEWVQNREISLPEFLFYLKKIKDII